jgi:hypothetical protein
MVLTRCPGERLAILPNVQLDGGSGGPSGRRWAGRRYPEGLMDSGCAAEMGRKNSVGLPFSGCAAFFGGKTFGNFASAGGGRLGDTGAGPWLAGEGVSGTMAEMGDIEPEGGRGWERFLYVLQRLQDLCHLEASGSAPQDGLSVCGGGELLDERGAAGGGRVV